MGAARRQPGWAGWTLEHQEREGAPEIDRGPEGGPGPDPIGADAVRGDHEVIYSNEGGARPRFLPQWLDAGRPDIAPCQA